jgi:TPR repeat protein
MKKCFLIGLYSIISIGVPAQQRGMYVVTDNGASIVRPPNERRVALVIGNNHYSHSALKNPINDATAMTTTLQSLGFEVDIVTDASRAAMTTAIQRLGRKAQGVNAVALFFYSGHGLQVNNDNFLVPIDAVVQSEPDVEVACVSLNYLMRQLEQSNSGTNIIILDACRNNPFSYNRSGGGGLATPSHTPNGTYIAFATAPLTTALDGAGNNSPYTTALLKAIKTPNAKIEDAFKIVRREVKRIGQTPWDNSSLDGDFYFNPQNNLENRENSNNQVKALNYLKAANKCVKGTNFEEYEKYMNLFHQTKLQNSEIDLNIKWWYGGTVFRAIESNFTISKHQLNLAFSYLYDCTLTDNYDACLMVGYIYEMGWMEQSIDYKKAFVYYAKATNGGERYMVSQYNLGICYSKGIGVEKDEEEAIKWFKKSAENGYANAQKELAASYEYGLGVNISLKEAIYWYEKSCKQNNEFSCKRLKILKN